MQPAGRGLSPATGPDSNPSHDYLYLFTSGAPGQNRATRFGQTPGMPSCIDGIRRMAAHQCSSGSPRTGEDGPIHGNPRPAIKGTTRA